MNWRPSIDQTLMNVAYDWARRGTCPRLQVGAVLARDGRQLAQGYNGAAAGLPHCAHDEDVGCDRAVHAEANVIATAAKYGVVTFNASLYITHSPCLDCTGMLINSGIGEVVYHQAYESKRSGDGRAALDSVGIIVRCLV